MDKEQLKVWQMGVVGLSILSLGLGIFLYFLLIKMNILAMRAVPPGMSIQVASASKECKLYRIEVAGSPKPSYMLGCHDGEI